MFVPGLISGDEQTPGKKVKMKLNSKWQLMTFMLCSYKEEQWGFCLSEADGQTNHPFMRLETMTLELKGNSNTFKCFPLSAQTMSSVYLWNTFSSRLASCPAVQRLTSRNTKLKERHSSADSSM